MIPAPTSSGPALRVEDLHVSYGGAPIVRGVSLSVEAGEIVSLLGPSGCGKTTTLRSIAGFVVPDAGSIHVHGRDITRMPANKRNVGLVFQGYALFPHLSVFDNVAYGLRTRRLPWTEIDERVRRVLGLVKLTGYEDRRPKHLSGGQQQRVAIARALVIEPELLLLDEPLSNLDAKLRHEMRIELRRLLKEMRIGSIFVTHDQEEAIVLSDRILLMNEGRVEQQGTPQDIYNRPQTLFVAAFLGQANFLAGEVKEVAQDGTALVDVAGHLLRGVACSGLSPGAPATLVVKCERVSATGSGRSETNSIECRFEHASFLGPSVQLQCTFKGQRVVALVPASSQTGFAFHPAMAITLSWGQADTLVFPREG